MPTARPTGGGWVITSDVVAPRRQVSNRNAGSVRSSIACSSNCCPADCLRMPPPLAAHRPIFGWSPHLAHPGRHPRTPTSQGSRPTCEAMAAPQAGRGSGSRLDPARPKRRLLPRRTCRSRPSRRLSQQTFTHGGYPLDWRSQPPVWDAPSVSGFQRANPANPTTTAQRLPPGAAVRVEDRCGQRPLMGYGGAPTPATECVPQGVSSVRRAGTLRRPTDSVADRDRSSDSRGSGPRTVPCQW